VSDASANGAAQGRDFHLWLGARTDVGRVRAVNQDSIGTWKDLPQTIAFAEQGYLFAVADGVGGNEGGEIASALAIETLLHSYYGDDTADIPNAIKRAVRKANEAIYEKGLEQPDQDRAMGTTLVVGVIRARTLTVGNVGDSRAYLFRGRTQSTQITKDHSLVAEAVRAGQMTAEQAKTSRQRNVITRALGQRQRVDVDIFEVDLLPDDVVLLCSDGLHGIVEDAEMKQIVQAMPPEQAVDELIDLANNRNASDNVSVIVVKATEEETPVSAPKAPPMAISQRSTDRIPEVTTARTGPPIAAIAIAAVVLLAAIAAVLFLFILR
jgi:serine/threonine protein phosphatase PrpC